MGLTFKQFTNRFPDDDTCLKYIFNQKYGNDYKCPQCGKSGWHKLNNRKAYGCQTPRCGYHLYPCKDTPFAKSKTSLQSWFYAMYLFSTSRHGVPAKELQRQLGVTYKCAWRMAHEIREHMAKIDEPKILKGEVEVDETYIGGKGRGTRGRGAKNKTPVLGLVERGGNIKTKVIKNASKKTLEKEIKENVEQNSKIYSDEWKGYKNLKNEGYEHETVKHGEKEYVRGSAHTNTLEGHWARLKSSIKGTHIHVSKKHLHKYGGEFDYRYNRRSNPDLIFGDLVSNL
jgi:transposase